MNTLEEPSRRRRRKHPQPKGRRTNPAASAAAPGVFTAFCHDEAAVDLPSNPTLNPEAKIPSLKYCGVRVTKVRAPSSKTGFDTQLVRQEALA